MIGYLDKHKLSFILNKSYWIVKVEGKGNVCFPIMLLDAYLGLSLIHI